MATMIPEVINGFKTEGERRFYRFLESAAKPDQNYTTWYLPDIDGREPDFILFCQDTGIVIFEVKDWALGQIEEANPHIFTLRMGRDRRTLKNPLQQAREYYESLVGRIRADGKLLSKDSRHYGKPKVPIDYGVVFPNISRERYCNRGLDQVLSARRVFFAEDMDSDSNICRDDSGNCFREVLGDMFPPKFHFSISPTEYHHLKQLIFPVIRIDQPQRNTCAYFDPSERVTVLDDIQESIARKSFSGMHVISGPSGSGKTLILVHKAVFLKRYNPEIRDILYVCSNPSLVNFIKRLLSNKGIGIGPNGVEVCHFLELCSRILGNDVQLESNDPGYIHTVIQETLPAADINWKKFDAILVDEGEVFTDEMYKLILCLPGDGRKNITIAQTDTREKNDGKTFWKQISPDLKVHTDKIDKMYRSTSEIRHLALSFAGMEQGRSPGELSTYCEMQGPKPEMRHFSNWNDIANYAAETIRVLYSRGEYPLAEFALLYAHLSTSQNEEGEAYLPESLVKALEAKGIMANWASEDYRSRRSYDVTTERVTIAAIDAVRGLDYACVFVLGLDQNNPGKEKMDEAKAQAHLAITRARHRLYIPYTKETAIIAELLSCL